MGNSITIGMSNQKINKIDLEKQKEFNKRVEEAKNQVALLLAIYQKGQEMTGYEFEEEIESALKQSYFALERI